MSTRVLARIDDMLAASKTIEEIIEKTDDGQMIASTIKMFALERAIEIVSEASRHVPDDLKQTEPNIPWRQIAGIGNILRHDYQTTRSSVLLNVARFEIPTLVSALLRMQATLLIR